MIKSEKLILELKKLMTLPSALQNNRKDYISELINI